LGALGVEFEQAQVPTEQAIEFREETNNHLWYLSPGGPRVPLSLSQIYCFIVYKERIIESEMNFNRGTELIELLVQDRGGKLHTIEVGELAFRLRKNLVT